MSSPSRFPAEPTSGLSRGRTLAFTLIAIFLPIVLFLSVFEIALRSFEPPPLASRGRVLRRSDNPKKRYELIPGAHGIVAGADVVINSFGCRDREFAAEKPAGVVRIVGIGDSLTFGQGVGQDETWLARLRDEFDTQKRPVQVINCGVFGYNSEEDAARFAEVADLLKPDIIVVGYELGDILRNPPPRREAVESETGARPDAISFSRSVVQLVRRSRVVTFLAYRLSFVLKALSLRSWDAVYEEGSPPWEALSKDYDEMGRIAASRNIAVLVALIPELSNLNEHYPHRAVDAKVATLCRREGMHVVDLLPSFLGQDGPRLWVHPQDRHPNAIGCAIIARGVQGPLSALVAAKQAERSTAR